MEGGGIIVLLLSSMDSLTQLYSLTMDVHARLRTDSHQDVTGVMVFSFHADSAAGKTRMCIDVRILHCFLWLGSVDFPNNRIAGRTKGIVFAFTGRFNERLVLSLASNPNCIIMDDELNILPTSSRVREIKPIERNEDGSALIPASQNIGELKELVDSLQDTMASSCLLDYSRSFQ